MAEPGAQGPAQRAVLCPFIVEIERARFRDVHRDVAVVRHEDLELAPPPRFDRDRGLARNHARANRGRDLHRHRVRFTAHRHFSPVRAGRRVARQLQPDLAGARAERAYGRAVQRGLARKLELDDDSPLARHGQIHHRLQLPGRAGEQDLFGAPRNGAHP